MPDAADNQRLTMRPPVPATVAIVLGVASFLLIYMPSSFHGLGISPDSVSYLSTAQNLADGAGFVQFDGEPMILWPPLFPLILAAGAYIGIPPELGARYLMSAIFAATVVLSFLWLRRHVRSPWLVGAGVALIMLGRPMMSVHYRVWTEPLFILLTIAFLWTSERLLKSPTWRDAALLGLLAGLAWTTRFIGITVLGCGFLCLLLIRWDILKRLGAIGIFALLSAGPMAIWLLHNWQVAHTLTGPRYPSTFGFLTNIGRTGYRLLSSIFSRSLASDVPDIVYAAVFLAAAILIARALVRLYKRRGSEALAEWLPYNLFIVVYLGFLVFTASTVAFDEINNRLISPAYVPFIFMSIAGLDVLNARHRKIRLGKLNLRWVAALFVLYAVVESGLHAMSSAGDIMEKGRGFRNASWRDSEIVTYVAKHSFDGPVYSNIPDILYVWTGKSVKTSAANGAYNSNAELDELAGFRSALSQAGPAYLVWFDGKWRDFLATPDELSAVVALEPVAKLKDGRIFRISAEQQPAH